MDRFKENSWDKKDEQDNTEFLEMEREINLKTFPHMAELVAENNQFEGEDGKCDEGVNEVNDDSESSGRDEEVYDEEASSDSSGESSGSDSGETC